MQQLCARLYTIFIAMIGTMLIGSAPCAMGDEPAPPKVTAANPIAKTVPTWDEYTGRFEAIQQVEIRPRVSGAIDSIHFTDGQLVKQGDLLFVVDPRPFEIAVESAKADVARAKAQVKVAAYDLKRGQELIKTRVIGQSELEHFDAEFSVAKAEQLRAEAALRNAELKLEWTQVRAPISGRASDHRIDIGNLVEGGQADATLLTTIVTLDPIHFVFDASEADYIRYARLSAAGKRELSREVSHPVMVKLADEPDWSNGRSGTMNFVDNQLNARGGTIRGRAVLENRNLFLIPGTFGRLRLFGGELDALLIPDATILSDQAKKIVFVVDQDNRIAQRTVTLGPIHNDLRVVIDGLAKSDLVVIDGVANPFVRPGAEVDVKQTSIHYPADAAAN
jgi:multidrug efflux system membrane fusion protein